MKFPTDYDLSIIDFNNRIKSGADAFNGHIKDNSVLPVKPKQDASILIVIGAAGILLYAGYRLLKEIKQLNTDKKLANAVISDSNKQPEQ